MAEISFVLPDLFQTSIPRSQGHIPACLTADRASVLSAPLVALYEPGGKLFPVYRSAHYADGSISGRRHGSGHGQVDSVVVSVSQVHEPVQAVLVYQREVAASVGGGQDRQVELVESGPRNIGGPTTKGTNSTKKTSAVGSFGCGIPRS